MRQSVFFLVFFAFLCVYVERFQDFQNVFLSTRYIPPVHKVAYTPDWFRHGNGMKSRNIQGNFKKLNTKFKLIYLKNNIIRTRFNFLTWFTIIYNATFEFYLLARNGLPIVRI